MIDLVTIYSNKVYWVVGSDRTRAWSFSLDCYVNEWPDDAIFIESDSELSLSNFLRSVNKPGPVPADPTTDDRLEAAETIIDLLLMEGE